MFPCHHESATRARPVVFAATSPCSPREEAPR